MPTLDWINRADAFTTAPRVPYRLLELVSTHVASHASHAPTVQADLIQKISTADSPRLEIRDNLLIQGDNLEALKALLPFYRGQVKCIFIDPPYNTKSAFEHYDDNLEHAQWLSMMLPRLQKMPDGEQGGIGKAVNCEGGGGFRFMKPGAPAFDAGGRLHPDLRFASLAAFVWQQETGTAFDLAGATSGRPHIGRHDVIDSESPAADPVSLAPPRLAAAGVTFKQIPYDVKAR